MAAGVLMQGASCCGETLDVKSIALNKDAELRGIGRGHPLLRLKGRALWEQGWVPLEPDPPPWSVHPASSPGGQVL